MTRKPKLPLILPLLGALACAVGADVPPPPQETGAAVKLPDEPQRLFDFWLGEWDVANRHVGEGTWEDTGVAVARIQPVVDGGAVLEQWSGTVKGNPLIGFSLRAYDPRSKGWSIWLNWHGGSPGGFSPMVGSRNGERIEQFAQSGARTERYSFYDVHENSARWEDAGSDDDGATWAPRWVMDFTRRDAPLPADATNVPIVHPPASAASFAETRQLDFLIGAWEGAARTWPEAGAAPVETTARARVTSMIEGFGLLSFVDTAGGERSIAAMGWDARTEAWGGVRADSARDGIDPLSGTVKDRTATFTTNPGDLRESWSCPTDDRCDFVREARATQVDWHPVLEASFTRSASTAAYVNIPYAQTPLPGVLTGGQPDLEQLAWAARNGYRSVVNLRAPGENGELADEAAEVDTLGMRYVTIPIGSLDDLVAENARLLLAALEADGALPAIVHCQSGNRVGALFAVAAHEVQGKSADEALHIGRQSGMSRMEPAVRQKLGLPPAE